MVLLEILLLICLWLLKRGCRRRRRLGRKVVRKRKSEICPVKKIRRAGECGRAGQAGRKYSGEQEALLACIKI